MADRIDLVVAFKETVVSDGLEVTYLTFLGEGRGVFNLKDKASSKTHHTVLKVDDGSSEFPGVQIYENAVFLNSITPGSANISHVVN